MSDISILRQARSILDGARRTAHSAVDPRIPLFRRAQAIERRGRELATALEQAEAAAALLADGGPRARSAGAAITQTVDGARSALEHLGLRQAKFGIEVPYAPGRLDLHVDRLQLLERVDGMSDDAAREVVEHAVERALPGIAAEDATAKRQLAGLVGLPEQLRSRYLATRFAPRTWEISALSSSKGYSITGEDMAREAAAALDRHALARLSTSDREARVASLLDRAPDSLSRAEVRELALAASLPADLVPAPLARESLREPGRMRELTTQHTSRIDGVEVRRADDGFLREVEAQRLVTSGQVPDRASVLDEIVDLLDAPVQELSPGQQRRLSVLVRLPVSHGPPMPVAKDAHGLYSIGIRAHPLERPEVVPMGRDAARRHFADVRHPGPGLAELRRAIVEDVPFDLDRLPALLDDRNAMAAAGVTDSMVELLFVRELRHSGSAVRGENLRNGLEIAARRLQAELDDPELEALRLEAVELIDRNIDRMLGRRADTYGRHPDYAEVGRVVATVRLLARLADDTVAGPGAGQAAAGAAGLTW